MAAQRRQGADAVPEERGASRHLRHSVFGLFFSFTSSSSACSTTTVRSCSDSSPSLDALLWAPAAFQALTALKTGARWTNTGCVVRGGAGDGHLAGTVSYYGFIVLQTSKTSIIYFCYLKASLLNSNCA